MKTILFLLMMWIVLASCSTRKNVNYFHVHRDDRDTYVTKKDAPLSVNAELLVASNSEVMPAQDRTPKRYDINAQSSLRKVNREARKGMPVAVALDTLKKKSVQDKVKVGDKKKNGFAIVGFALSFSPIYGTLIAAFLSPGTGVGIVLGALGFFTALVFCFIGKKSERRGLAKAGLWIMLAETILLILGIIAAVGIARSIN